ncbi:MAG: glucose-1-phosphate adenylyltransferase [Armatimonadota bacterium]
MSLPRPPVPALSGFPADTTIMLLAGGQGERLYPLTRDRAKPAVYFGGIYRIIDFTLSNCVNSGARRILLLTQYKSLSLDRHIRRGWGLFSGELDEYIYTIPPQQRMGEQFYLGTADAIYQNIYSLEQDRPENVLILSGDHVYKMDYRPLLAFHLERDADLTVSCVEVDAEYATTLGVAEVDEDWRVVGFHEKPAEPQHIPGRPGRCLCSMGVYVFRTERLVKAVIEDAKSDTSHDFGRDVIPALVQSASVYAYSYVDPDTGEAAYWRDIGTLDNYFEANMDLVAPVPPFNLYDPNWPIRAHVEPCPPARVARCDGAGTGAEDSLISGGCILDAAHVVRSVLSPNVRVEEGAEVVECVLFPGVRVEKGARLRRTIVDRNMTIPAGTEIGHDAERDRRAVTLTPSGVAVVPRMAPQIAADR